MSKIELGSKVRSTVSGFEGTVTGIIEYLHCPKRAQITAPKLTDGAIKTEWLFLTELEVVE